MTGDGTVTNIRPVPAIPAAPPVDKRAQLAAELRAFAARIESGECDVDRALIMVDKNAQWSAWAVLGDADCSFLTALGLCSILQDMIHSESRM